MAEFQGTITSVGFISGTIVGIRGPKGETGEKGDPGATGNGIASAVLNADYTLTLTFTNGETYTTGPIRGPQGERGIDGVKGDTGLTPNLTIGTVTALDTGSASATITGTTDDPVLNLGLPKGNTGATGTTPALSIGSVTTLPAGSSVTVTITGTAEAPILNFGIPKGDPGQDGGIDVDDAISSTSFHPVQNRVIYNALQGKADTADIPTKTSDLTNDSGFLTQHQDISGKVDKVTGKGLSTNDYTTTEKNKLAGIAAGAEVNVQSDWNQATSTADDYIKNKPAIPTKVSDLTNDSGFVGGDVVADEYSPSSAYAVGDYCIFDGQFYRCTTAISTAEEWTAAHWTMVTVVEELTDLKDYITPQMFGAKADGVTDDTAAIQDALDSGYDVYFPKGIYSSDTLYVSNDNILINGGGSSILFGKSSGFVIPSTKHDIEICNINSELVYVKDSEETTNSHIALVGIESGEHAAYNVNIHDCTFVGGVMGISAASSKNLSIVDCAFDSFVYKPEDSAGGYGILLQSCINVKIKRSRFSLGKYGRHDVYVSVDRTKSDHVLCKNIVIDACSFDHSSLELDGDNHYYSSTTVPINVRTSIMVAITNCYFYSTVGMVTYYSEDGDIVGGILSGCVIDSPVANSGSLETKYAINVPPTDYSVTALINGISVVNEPNDYQSFASLWNCNIKITNCDIGATRILCANDVIVQLDNITTKITYYFIRFNGSDQTKGYCRNITFLVALIGDKYYYASGASVSDGFFVHGYSDKSYDNNTYCYRKTELARCGDIVQCSIGVLKDLPQNTFITLFKLDEEYRPRQEVAFTLITRDASKNLIQGWIKTDGDIIVYNLSTATSGNLNVNETISYIGSN